MPTHLLSAVDALGFRPIGRSIEGRPIPAHAFGATGPAPALVVVGGVHGNEPASVEAALDLVAALAASPPADRRVIVVPALNPDGLAAGKKNSAREVDLNRNFPARNFAAAHAAGYFPGERPLSEPETSAFAELVQRERPVGVVAVHAPFACVNYDGPAGAWAARVAAACGWPVREDLGYPTPGSLGSWLGVDLGLPVLTLELPEGDYGGFREPARAALRAAVEDPFVASA